MFSDITKMHQALIVTMITENDRELAWWHNGRALDDQVATSLIPS